ncbi:MAG TPA: phosphoenolpyruvate--protein phosphotransferase [Pirellulales bacterium]|nr:phosphoenolpyruvate--protein phosphotransferase [Pirellulales bacterium]
MSKSRRRVSRPREQERAAARPAHHESDGAATVSRRAVGPRTQVLRAGVAVSPGVAIGQACCLHEIFPGSDALLPDDDAVLRELARYDQARDQVARDLKTLFHKVSAQLGQRAAAIFQVHESILHDPALTAKLQSWIVEARQTAPAALRRLLEEYTTLFERTSDEYLRERLADVRDVVARLTQQLSAVTPDARQIAGPVILVANELIPSHVATLDKREVMGIVTQVGGRTSHAAILARGHGIPAVSGVANILHEVADGDLIVVDGREGHVIVHPDVETARAYRRLRREFVDLKDHLAHNRDQPAVSAEGEPVELLANISNLTDVKAAASMGASGVGLYRTEYLFLTHHDVPDEEEQVAAYRAVIAASPAHRVTFRTLDVGGDKKMRYLGLEHEANPFMGWRSIRLSFEHPAFFLTQIRAVLRAAAPGHGPRKRVGLMFPMITTLDEMRRVRSLVRKACRQLDREGLPFGNVPIGLMVEVPAAAITVGRLAQEADFVSIGSNDLVQYLTAADRDNPKVSHLCDPLSPAVIEVLYQTIRSCLAAGKLVTLCGEMAAAPRAFLLLFGMGLRSYSMSPAFIPIMKELAKQLSREQAEAIVEKTRRMATTKQIVGFLGKQLSQISPGLSIVDSAK